MKFIAGIVPAHLLTPPSYADEFSAHLGAFTSFSPDYEGSDDYEIGGLPFLSLGWQSDLVRPESGSGFQFGLHEATLNLPGSLELGIAKYIRPEGVYQSKLAIAYNGGRKQDNNNALNGMGDIDAHALASIGIEFQPHAPGWSYGITYTSDISGETDGSTIDGRVGYAYPIRKDLTASLVGNLSWANKGYMQSYFGVSTQQAVRSTNARFDADSGLKSPGLEAGLNWTITENWVANGGVTFNRLINDAADSPLVEGQGTANQLSASLGLIHIF